MLYLTILILLTIFLYIRLKKITYKSFHKMQSGFKRTENECDKALEENTRLKKENSDLGKTVEETVALYEITKQICKSLDQDEVYANFCEQINKYIKVGDCKFLKKDADLSEYSRCTVLPLDIGKSPIGYLLASGIKQDDMDKFHILSQQFLLGLKRALLYQRVQELAITDSLTGASSRRYCLERLSEEIERSKKFNYAFSFLMADIDHFKDYNDRYGHLVGDAILREVSQTIKENIRQIDLMGRYGGEEFSIILTETDKKQAKFAAERIRKSIEDRRIRVYDEDLKVTVSIGASTFPEDAKDMQALIEKADSSLYKAKQTGRNRVC